jgi:Stress-induced morphogen (activity unknown)
VSTVFQFLSTVLTMPLHIVIYLVLQDVVDDSDGCGGNFTVLIVSDKFEGKGILQRHRY